MNRATTRSGGRGQDEVDGRTVDGQDERRAKGVIVGVGRVIEREQREVKDAIDGEGGAVEGERTVSDQGEVEDGLPKVGAAKRRHEGVGHPGVGGGGIGKDEDRVDGELRPLGRPFEEVERGHAKDEGVAFVSVTDGVGRGRAEVEIGIGGNGPEEDPQGRTTVTTTSVAPEGIRPRATVAALVLIEDQREEVFITVVSAGGVASPPSSAGTSLV